ncbi:MAG: glycosyltransferase family 39 protein [Gemmatimonadales bacterium]
MRTARPSSAPSDRRLWLVLGLTLAAAVLRWNAAAASSAFWTDEAEFLAITRLPTVGAVVRFLRDQEAHPPLFYVAERLWLALAGTTDRAAVALPILCGVLLVPLAYVAGSRLFSARAGIAAAILVAAGPFLAHYSDYARPYSALSLLTLASVLLLYRSVESGGMRWAAYALVTAVLLLIHNWSWLVFAGECFVIVLWIARAPSARSFVLVPWLASLAGVGVLFAPWLPAFLTQLRHAGHAARQGWTAMAPFYPYLEFARVGLGLPAALSGVLIAGLIGVAAWGGRTAGRDRPTGTLALLLCAGVPFVAVTAAGALSGFTWLTPEYCLLIPVPVALIAVARGLDVLAERRSAAGLLGATVAITVIYLLTWSALAGVGKSNVRTFAAELDRRVGRGDLLLVHPGFVAPSLNYYFVGDNSQIDYPFLSRQRAIPYDHMPERVANLATVRATLDSLRAARQQSRRVWFITRCDWFEFPRILPARWVELGLITSDVPPLVSRFYEFRDELIRLYGEPNHPLPPDQGPKREVLCAELYAAPSEPASSRP